jgi:RecQ family ATP-dependent DNA helicase
MPTAHAVLQDTFGYSEFRGQQQAVIDTLINGHDALVIMPTGGGKSLCYQIPSLVREGCGVVISPLIALMEDQVNALKELGIRAGFLNSTQNAEENYRVENALVSGELELLYIAPERLNQTRMVNLLQRSTIALFAIDEAHCVSQWGHDFRADYLQLHQLEHLFPHVPRVALTATADARTQQEIIERLRITHAESFLAGFDRPNIFYQIELKQQPKQQLLRFIKEHHKNDAGIVYCLSRKKTEDIAAHIPVMLGCASFSGVDVETHLPILNYLYEHHLADPALKPIPKVDDYIDLTKLERPSDSLENAQKSIPTLLRGYLKLGAKISDAAIVDHAFNTVYVAIYVETSHMLKVNPNLVTHV